MFRKVKIQKIIGGIILILAYNGCSSLYKPYIYAGSKIKGLSLVAPPEPIDKHPFLKIKALGTNMVSLMPYAFLPKNRNEIRFSKISDPLGTRQPWWGETPAGIVSCIDLAHAQGLKVMLKPHLWIGNGTFTGDLNFNTEAAYLGFEKTYEEYLLQYATIAAANQVEAICIGTELATLVNKRPIFWRNLILKIRKIYNGHLTYAENWDKYPDTDIWKDLDFIGVDAYFPLSKNAQPTHAETVEAWKIHKKALAQIAAKYQKPIWFTELGYKAHQRSLEKPWEVKTTEPADENLQAMAYEAFFDSVWSEKWFAGVFFWKWFPNPITHTEAFSPQGRGAEKVLLEKFNKLK